MATDIIICPFSIPPQARARAVAQPLELFKNKPVVIGLEGIGSDVFMGPTDTERKPREPWGGAPFSREAAMYRAKGDGSVLQGLLRTRARGIEPKRIAVVGFSAGGTFVNNLLKEEQDRNAIDVVMLLDALHVPKAWNGTFVPQSLEGWATYGANALLAGVRAERGTDNKDPFLGPVFITAHTNIKQSPAIEKQVGNTTASSAAVFEAAIAKLHAWQNAGHVELGGIKTVETDWRLMTSVPESAFPVAIGPAPDKTGVTPWARTAAPTKTWMSMPFPNVRQAAGNFYDFDYGGTVAADHVFQAWHVQGALWRTFLAPRWNAEFQSPYAVAGLGGGAPGLPGVGAMGAFARCCPGEGGNLVARGYFDTGVGYGLMAGAAGLGFLLGKTIVEEL